MLRVDAREVLPEAGVALADAVRTSNADAGHDGAEQGERDGDAVVAFGVDGRAV